MKVRSKRIAVVCTAAVAWWIFVYLLPAIFDWPVGGQDRNPVPGPPRDTALLLGALMLLPGTALAVFLLIRARAVLIGVAITLATAIPMVAGGYLSNSWCPNIYANGCHGTTAIGVLTFAPPLIGTVLFGMLFGYRRGLRPSSLAAATLVVIVIASFIFLPETAASSPFDGDDFFFLYAAWPFSSLFYTVLLAVPAAIGVLIGQTWSNHAAREQPADMASNVREQLAGRVKRV